MAWGGEGVCGVNHKGCECFALGAVFFPIVFATFSLDSRANLRGWLFLGLGICHSGIFFTISEEALHDKAIRFPPEYQAVHRSVCDNESGN